jgi:hypothetical protein
MQKQLVRAKCRKTKGNLGPTAKKFARLVMARESDQVMEQERRRMPRVPFVAQAELLEVDTGTRMNAQVSELSLHGCYVDTLNPLPKGTSVYVKIFTQEYFFETPAIVVYAHAQLGMGLAFHDVKPHFVGVLQNWVMASTGKKGSEI